jgi:bifunctional non-homologous end joining protein LigD
MTLDTIEARGGDGTLELPEGHTLEVSNVDKVLWPSERLTKGDLLRYYVTVSPSLLPAVADRPLVMRRFPNGITNKAFYQQRAPQPVPQGVRVEVLPSDKEVPNRLVGGFLLTLLYMAQLAVISQDPWFSTVHAPDEPDQVAFDLDPMPGVTFVQVRDMARWVHDELQRLEIPHVLKTSGASGLHISVPLPAGTSYESGRLFCQIIATLIAHNHPKQATAMRSVDAKGRRVYIDYLQNVRGKTFSHGL